MRGVVPQWEKIIVRKNFWLVPKYLMDALRGEGETLSPSLSPKSSRGIITLDLVREHDSMVMGWNSSR